METHGQVIWNMALFVDDVPMISMMFFHGKPVDKKRERVWKLSMNFGS
jgi:hypothetical protein